MKESTKMVKALQKELMEDIYCNVMGSNVLIQESVNINKVSFSDRTKVLQISLGDLDSVTLSTFKSIVEEICERFDVEISGILLEI